MMKNLKKLQAVWLIGLLFAAAGCRDFLSGPETPADGGAGTVVISIGDGTGAARTLMPAELDLDRLTYELTFSGGPGGAVHEPVSMTPGTQAKVSLAPGNWTIRVFEKSGETVLAAGEWAGDVSAAGTTQVELTLSPITGGAGRLICLFTFPEEVTGKFMALYKVSPGAADELVDGTPVTNITSGVPGRFDNLAAGFYRLSLRLEAGEKTAARTESVHIYAGLTTHAEWAFAAGDFDEAPPAPLNPPEVASGGIRTLNVSWDAVDGATGYEVWYGTSSDSGSAAQSGGEIPSSAPRTAVITGLTTGTPCYVWVKAKNTRGTSGFGPHGTGTPAIRPVVFRTTEDNSSGTVLEDGSTDESWTLSVTDQPAVYFAVEKTPDQTIEIGGIDGGLVTQAASGETVDGSEASETLSVFTADASAFDLMFEGGTRAFTLTVQEETFSKTVTVNLNTATDLTGVAVFKVARSADQEIVAAANGIPAQAEQWARAGSLERIPDLKKWDLAGNMFTGTDADSLLDAIAWVDQNAATGEEYLIRVEQDEEAPHMRIIFAGQDKVTLRLRGYGAERTIKHNGVNTEHYQNPAVNLYLLEGYEFFLMVGGYDSSGAAMPGSTHSLHLENHITFDGKGPDRMDNDFRGLINIKNNSRLILLEGSKITNYNGTSGSGETFVPVFIQGGMSAPGSEEMLVSFYMYGGAITGNDLTGPNTVTGMDSVGYTPVFFNTRANTTGSSSAERINQPVFFIFGGSYSGNFRHPVSGGEPESGDKVRFGRAASSSIMYDIEPGHAYALPEFN